MNNFTKDVAEAIGCQDWTGEGCDNNGECYCRTAAERVLRHVADALGTDETGEALVEVARNAHRAEQKLAMIEIGIYRIVKEVESGEANRPGFDLRSYDVGYMEGENSTAADRAASCINP